jgi:multiple sugar transport system substrate-binding protein
MKAWIKGLTAAVLTVSLAACGSGGSSSSGGDASKPAAGSDGSKAAESKPVTLRFSWWGSQPRHDYTLKVIDMYQKQHPNVKIEPEYAAFDDYWKKLAPQAAAGELPDIIQMDISYISQYGGRNQLADLTPFVNNKLINTADISPNFISGGKLGDKLYGFSTGVNALNVQYDPALLKKIGLDKIPDNWTWDDYKSYAQKAGQAGLYFDEGLRPEVFFSYYLRQNGKTLYSADGTQLGYDDDKMFVDYFGMTTGSVKAKGSPTPDVTAQIKGVEDDLVVKSKAISNWQWSNQYAGLQKTAGRPLEIAPLPGPNANKGLYLKPSMYLSISQNSKNKDEAAKFIDFFINDIEANKLILGDRGVPGSSKVKEALKPMLSPELQKVFDFVAWAEKNSSAMDPIDPVGAGEVGAIFKTYDEMMKFGKITPEEAAKKFRAEANAVLAKNKK